MAACLRQTVPNRLAIACVRKRYSHKRFCVYTKGDKGTSVGCRSKLSSCSVPSNDPRRTLRGCAGDAIEADSPRGVPPSSCVRKLPFGYDQIWSLLFITYRAVVCKPFFLQPSPPTPHPPTPPHTHTSPPPSPQLFLRPSSDGRDGDV